MDEKESPQFQLPGSRTHPHMLFWCSAEISPHQTHNLKSTNSRGCNKDQGKGRTHTDQMTKRTNTRTLSLVSELSPVSLPGNYSWDESVFVSEPGLTTSGAQVGDGCRQQVLVSALL